MNYAELLSGLALDMPSGDARIRVGDDWGQGRTLFGGLQAAIAVEALRPQVPDDAPLRVLQATFIGPVPPGEVRVSTRILRRGSSAMQGEARLCDADGNTQCLVLAVFGKARPSSLAFQPTAPAVRPAAESNRFPYIEGLTPKFTRYFQMALAEGQYPFMSAPEPRTRTWVRHTDPAPTSLAHLIATADTIPSPALSMLKKPAMASSLTWTLELINPRCDFDPQADWLMDAEVTAGGDGYLNQTATLFNPAGEAAAYSRQTVVVFG